METNFSENSSNKTSDSSPKKFLPFLFLSGVIFTLLSLFYSFPSTLQYYPLTKSHAGGYVFDFFHYYQTNPIFYHVFYILFSIAIVIAILSIVLINKNWKWGFGLLFFPLVQIVGSIINFNLGTCSSDSGLLSDGPGRGLIDCSYGFSPSIMAGFIVSLTLLIIAIAFLEIYRRQQKAL